METHVSDALIDAVLARSAGGSSATNLAAVMVGERTPPGLDGQAWLVVVSDGSSVGTVEASLAGSKLIEMAQEDVVLALEKRAGAFAVESRFSDFVAASPFWLRDD